MTTVTELTAPLTPRQQPFDEGRLASAVAVANLPTLLMVLFQLTGEARWLQAPYRPKRTKGMSDNDSGGLPEHVQAEVRIAAVEALRHWGHGRPTAIKVPDEPVFIEMLSACMGEDVAQEFAPMMIESLVGRSDVCHPDISPEQAAMCPVVIVGAGISGLAAAVELKSAGLPFVILEKNLDVGGTWMDNRYPGCGVDTPSYVYSLSYLPRRWSTFYGKRPEVHRYVREVAESQGLLDHVRFGTEVVQAHYDEVSQTWEVLARSNDGEDQRLHTRAVITAVGQLNRPRVPSLAGAERFTGQIFHSADWPEGLDVTGKRVVVVGAGASAMQIVPAIADDVAQLTVVQRSPQWAAPSDNYFSQVSADTHWLMDHVPGYHAWYRMRLAWLTNDRLYPSLQIDPEWPHLDRSINVINEAHRKFFTDYLLEQLDGRLDLVEKSLPTYPPFGKRMLIDNGWFAALRKPNVDLVVDGVAALDEAGLVTATGQHIDADVVVLATGFEAKKQLWPMDIRGRGGRGIRDLWGDDDARAYLGIAVPEFPNLFVMYGPNTNLGHGGSYMYFAERQSRFIVAVLAEMLSRGLGSVEVRRDVHDEYNRRVDEAHSRMIWSHPGMDTWYRNDRGRVVTNSPWRVVDYWAMTKQVDLDDWVLEPVAAG